MMYLFESPYPALFIGIFLLAGLAIALAQTRDKRLAVGLVLVFVGMLGMMALEVIVVTPREEVEQQLDALAAALEANDARGVLASISAGADARDIRGKVEWAMTNVHITKTKIRNLTVNVKPISGEATAEFDGIITGEYKGQPGASGPYPRRFVLYYRRDTPNGPWVVYKYDERNMVGGP